MDALQKFAGVGGCRRFSHGLAALALAWSGGALAQDVVSVPAAHLQHAEGSIAYAPQGDKEWHDVQPRRLLKRGDRLWTDRGSRAEVQAGGHAVRLNGETQLVLENVGDTATQLSLTQGAMAATVTHMNPGDSFEVGTPNLAFRARQPGDYRIDVDPKEGITRIVVQSGSAVVYGEKGEALEVKNGQRVTFRARDLSRVLTPAFAANDDFDKWAGARRRGEPTVSMPAVAQAPSAPATPRSQFVNKGPDIVISGPAASLPGSKLGAQAQVAQAAAKPAPAAPAAPVAPQVAKAQPLPNVAVTPNAPPAATLRVTAPGTVVASAVPSMAAKAEAEARAHAQAEVAAQAAQAAREQQERERAAQARAEEERKAAARLEADRRAIAAAEAKRAESEKRVAEAKRAEAERRAEAKRAEKRAVAARRAEDERRAAAAQAKRAQEQKRYAAAKRAEEERRAAIAAKRAAEERKVAAAKRAAEERKIAEARKLQLARLQEQARRDEQNVQARREQARRAEDERRDEVRREEQARRDEDLRRQRALAEQARREQERRDEEVWLRQQQYFQPQPARPAPMGVPARRVS